MRGVSKLKPSRPKYDNIWDPGVVTNYINNQGPNENLSLKNLSYKLITLLMLITGHRLQTISLIRLSNIIQTPTGFQIAISDPIKTSKLNKVQPHLHIPFFQENPNLCVASTLKHYMDVSRGLRKADENFLFITHKKPHARATKQSLSRWVKDTLKLAGINTELFKAHSVRHASTSKAYSHGTPLETILHSAGWTTETTFTRFYHRPVTNNYLFAETILRLGVE